MTDEFPSQDSKRVSVRTSLPGVLDLQVIRVPDSTIRLVSLNNPRDLVPRRAVLLISTV